MKKVFDSKSPGFAYSIAAFILTLLAIIGVQFTQPIGDLSSQFETSIHGGSYFALLGLIAGSVLFPIWNLIQKKQKITLGAIFGSTANVVALVSALLGVIAVTGFILPEGTVEQTVAAVKAKDWTALILLLFNTIVPTIIRFIKSKKAPTTA